MARAPCFLRDDFPLGDGGLFKEMIDTVKTEHRLLPRYVVYNHEQIPFAYPPLGLYLGAAVSDALGISTLEVVRFLPLVLNLLTIAVFVLLAGRLLESRHAILLAAVLFPLLPRSYEYVITGGGVTRSLGFLFCLAAIYAASHLRPATKRLPLVLCLLSSSAAVLSHLEWGITTFVGLGLFLLLALEEKRHAVCLFIVLATGTLAISSVWWLCILLRFGPGPFLAASKTSGWSLGVFLDRLQKFHIFTESTYFVAWPLAIGFASKTANGKWFLPLWLLAVFMTTPRHAGTAATAPEALIAADGIVLLETYAWSLISSLAPPQMLPSSEVERKRVIRSLQACVVIAAACYMLLVASRHPLQPLRADQRAAMEWTKSHTPPDSSFVVLSSARYWFADSVSEWFPVLAERKSLVTVQGLEWLPDDQFQRAEADSFVIKRLLALQRFGDRSNALSRYIEARFGSRFRYVALFVDDAESVAAAFFEPSRYSLVYGDRAAVIIEDTRYDVARSRGPQGPVAPEGAALGGGSTE
jgi:hypothetical protein